ncbi:MAG: Rrf2 family transcriptional regulator [Candidatus Hydrogenedentes bacterium]|nr:Rrf2 family transcriptional regulator [Candidatus Hydrogenedentota bacterium]
MFSQTAEYALRAAVWLAQAGNQPLTTAVIAERARIPKDYLAKILKQMGDAKLVRCMRGINGGCVLARPAAEISLLDVIDAVDPIHRIEHCPLGLAEHRENLCPLHRRLDKSLATVRAALAESSLRKLSLESQPGPPLCEPKSQLAAKRRRTKRK